MDLGGGGTAYYVYDAGGQRVRKVIETQNGTLSEERIYLGGFEIYRKYRRRTRWSARRCTSWTTSSASPWSRRRRIESGSAISDPQSLIRYQFGNHLGSASLELDDDGESISYEEYYPYGTTSYQAVDSAAEVSLKRYRYTGKERDEETGLYYHGARYYCSWLGRWSACDPLGFVNGTNVYAYVTGNPIRLRDPSGTQGQECVEVIGLDLEKQGRFYPGPGCAQPAEPSLFAPIPRPGSKEARTPPLQIPKSVPKAPAKPKSPKDDPEVSDPEALRYAEGVGKIEAGDVEQFGKGLWNGPASWVNAPQFDIDPHYGGAAWVGEEMGKNLVLEVLTAGVGKLIGLGVGKARTILRGGEAAADAARVIEIKGPREVAGSMSKETPAAAKKIKYLNELTDAEFDAYMQSKFGAKWERAKEIGDWPDSGGPGTRPLHVARATQGSWHHGGATQKSWHQSQTGPVGSHSAERRSVRSHSAGRRSVRSHSAGRRSVSSDGAEEGAIGEDKVVIEWI